MTIVSIVNIFLFLYLLALTLLRLDIYILRLRSSIRGFAILPDAFVDVFIGFHISVFY